MIDDHLFVSQETWTIQYSGKIDNSYTYRKSKQLTIGYFSSQQKVFSLTHAFSFTTQKVFYLLVSYDEYSLRPDLALFFKTKAE